jgi:hypothetical protein
MFLPQDVFGEKSFLVGIKVCGLGFEIENTLMREYVPQIKLLREQFMHMNYSSLAREIVMPSGERQR